VSSTPGGPCQQFFNPELQKKSTRHSQSLLEGVDREKVWLLFFLKKGFHIPHIIFLLTYFHGVFIFKSTDNERVTFKLLVTLLDISYLSKYWHSQKLGELKRNITFLMLWIFPFVCPFTHLLFQCKKFVFSPSLSLGQVIVTKNKRLNDGSEEKI